MIAGIDPSTASLGLALPDGTLRTVKPRAGAKDPARRLDELEREVTRALRLNPPLPAVAIIEGPADHSLGIRSTIAIAEVRGVLKLALHRLDVPFVEIPPSRLKRYATGRGNADKGAMIAAANLDLELAGLPHAKNDDEADAHLLRHLGQTAYGLHPTPATGHRLEIVASIAWPHLERLPR